MLKISPSLLAADFTKLGEEVTRMEQAGAQMLHLDVMDGIFVPNLSFGIPVVQSLRKISRLEFDVHLMIVDPIRYIEAFAKAGADWITFHLESDSPVQETIDRIHAQGKKAGVSLKPATPAEAVFPYLDQLELVLVMTVEPGFGGQKFMADMMPKLAAIRVEAGRRGLELDLQVDGGIDPNTVGTAAKHGANVFVAGSALFGKPDYRQAVEGLMSRAGQA